MEWHKARASSEGDAACVELAWRKSSRSSDPEQAVCVEAAHIPGAVLFRDSKNPDAGHIELSSVEAARLFAQIKSGIHAL